MGRNKFSQREIDIIARLLRKKNAGTRYQQKMIRHDLRVKFEFNISDFNVQGQAFGDQELYAAIARGAIQILDEATIAARRKSKPLLPSPVHEPVSAACRHEHSCLYIPQPHYFP